MDDAVLNDDTPDLSVLIMSYDGFADEWEACDYCFNKYWKVNVPVYLVTNHLNPEMKFLKLFPIDDMCYSEGINKFVSQCTTEYVLLLMADFLPKKEVKNQDYITLIDTLKREAIDYCSIFKQNDKKRYYKKFKGYKDVLKIDNSLEYAINVMPAIWKTSLLKKLTEDCKFNPWEFEVSFQHESFSKSVMNESLNVYYKKPVYPLCHTIIKGKYTREGIKFLKKEKLFQGCGKRKKMGLFETLKMKISDGMPRKFKSSVKKFLVKLGYKFYSE